MFYLKLGICFSLKSLKLIYTFNKSQPQFIYFSSISTCGEFHIIVANFRILTLIQGPPSVNGIQPTHDLLNGGEEETF